MSDPVVIGVDAGGSGCRARAEGGPTVRVDAPANLLRAGATAAIRDCALQAAAAAGADPAQASLGVGAAGATAAGRRAFFADPWPFAAVRLITDAHAAALGAHGGAGGGVVILGTGAVACVATEGGAVTLGGWGFAVDDAGSGADLGRRVARAALRAADEGAADAPLAAAVLRRFGGAGALCDWCAAAGPADFATLAPLALEMADVDPRAAAIRDHAVAEMTRLARLAAAQGARRLCVMGSLGAALAPRLDTAALGLALTAPLGDAMDGAALAARRAIGWTAGDWAQW